MSRKLILWSSLIWASLAPVAWSQTPFSRSLVPTRSALGRVGLEQDWMAAIPLVGTERLAEVSIADTLLFAQTNHANFYTYDAESGRLLWSTTLGKKTGDVYPASANSRLVFVTNSNSLFALDRQTGRLVWSENLHVLPTSPTVCDEERVAVGLNNGLLRGFDLRIVDNKNVVKKDEKGQFVLAPKARFAWNWQTGGSLSSRPLFAGKLIAFGGHDGKLYVTMTEEAKPVYRFATGGPISAPLAYHGTRTLLVPSEDANVYAVDLFTGAVRWIFSAAAPVTQAPLVVGDDAYVVNTAGILYAVDTHTGESRWSTSTHGGRLLAASPSRLYLETHDDDLFIVDRTSGRIVVDPRSSYQRAGLNLREYNLGVTNDLNDRVYLGTSSGLIISLREIGHTQPHAIRDPKAPPLGYIPPEGLPDTQTQTVPLTPPLAPAPDEAATPKPDEDAAGEDKAAPKEEEDAPK